MLLPQSAFLWKAFPLVSDISYPWTLLAPLGLLISLFSGLIINHLKAAGFLLLAILLFAVLVSFPLIKTQDKIQLSDAFFLTNDASTSSQSMEYLPLSVKEIPTNLTQQKVTFISGKGNLDHIKTGSRLWEITGEFETKSQLRLALIYYPGWQLSVDGNRQSFRFEPRGLIEFDVPAGRHYARLEFKETPLRAVADSISLLAGITIMGLLIFARKIIRTR